MNIIDRKELRVLLEGCLTTGSLKNKTRKQQSKALGITAHQLQRYLDCGNIVDDAVQKLGQYFGKTVDNAEFKPASKKISYEKPRNDKQARDSQKEVGDAELTKKRRRIDEHQEMLRMKDLGIYLI